MVILTVFHVIFCLGLIFLVLLQSGKGAELGAAFGSVGQANQSRSNMSGIGKVTTVMAVMFFVTSFTLAYMSSEGLSDSVLKEFDQGPASQQEETLPAESDEATPMEEATQSGSEAQPMEQSDAPTEGTEAPALEQSDAPMELDQTDAPAESGTQPGESTP